MKRVLALVLLAGGCQFDSDPDVSTGAALTATVNEEPPSNCTYTSNPAIYTKGQAIPPNVLTCGGGAVTSATISPALPAGLSISSVGGTSPVGTIFGTPAGASTPTNYTVRASNISGYVDVPLSITVNDAAPTPPCTYASNQATYTRGQAIPPNVLTCGGGVVTSAMIFPALPAGLVISSSGTISGTPIAISNTTSYTVIVSNSGGSAFASLTITVGSGMDGGVNYIFVSSVSIAPGALGSAAAADSICSSLAANAGLPGTFIALLPSSTYSALQRIGSARGWYRTDGRPSLDTLAGHVFYAPKLTEYGAVSPRGQYAFTGLWWDGTNASNTCAFWTANTDAGTTMAGYPPDEYEGFWLTSLYTPCSEPMPFYCLGIDYGAPLVIPPPASARRAFISTGLFHPGGGIWAADALCQSEAQSAGLPGAFRALMSTETTAAGARFGNGANWYRADNIAMFPSASALLSAGVNVIPLAGLHLTADGEDLFYPSVWTGSQAPSVTYGWQWGSSCSNWTTQAGYGISGLAGDDYYWFSGSVYCSYANHVYCLEVGWKDHLGVNEVLGRGQSLRSGNGRYTLWLQSSDGHLVLYNSAGAAIWAAQPLGGDYLILQGDGNLVLYRNNGSVVWTINSAGSGAQVLNVQDDGNMVLYNAVSGVVWATNTAGR